MRTRLVIPTDDYSDAEAFWVECTDQEVEKHIFPLKNDALFEDTVKQNRGPNTLKDRENYSDYCNFFLISKDLKQIESNRWVMPFSGLWNSSNPFRMIEEVEFNSLKELKNVKINYVN